MKLVCVFLLIFLCVVMFSDMIFYILDFKKSYRENASYETQKQKIAVRQLNKLNRELNKLDYAISKLRIKRCGMKNKEIAIYKEICNSQETVDFGSNNKENHSEKDTRGEK